MIFIPPEDQIEIMNKTDEFEMIKWMYNDNMILFEWTNEPQSHKKHIPFYLHPIQIGRENVLTCPESACQCYPQLRYNKIIDKWFCNCTSSAICTKDDDDQDELDELCVFDKRRNSFDEQHGYCNDPIKAILLWNITVANALLNLNQKQLDVYDKTKSLSWGGLYE